MTRMHKAIYFAVSLAVALALGSYAHRASANQAFGGPGLFIDAGCADIVNQIDGKTWCFDPTAKSISVWNATTGAYQNPFVATFTLNFNNFSIFGVGGLSLAQLSPPPSVAASGTCSGTCATTYTYEVTCENDSGETTPSPAVTATNAASLSPSNFNTISWGSQTACSGGYNVYGNIAGSLGLLATVPSGTLSYVDNGAAAVPMAYTFKFSSPSFASIAVWDLRGANNTAPVDVVVANTGNSVSPKASALTTAANNETQIPVFGVSQGSGAFSAPGGFSNVANVAAATHNKGIWGGTKNIATAGAVAAVNATTGTSGSWATLDIAISPANPATPITIPGSLSAAVSSPYTSLTFNDPGGTASGDLEVICVSFANGTFLSAPSTFNLIGNVSFAPGFTQLSCYTNLPVPSTAPPTTNTTGILTQSTPSGTTYRETLLGLQSFSANTANAPNGASGTVQSSISYPVDMTVQSCRATWFQYAGCSPFPVFALKDVTAGAVLCSSGTVSGTNTDKAITPQNFKIPANDVIGFLATTTGVSCTTGQAALSIVLHE